MTSPTSSVHHCIKQAEVRLRLPCGAAAAKSVGKHVVPLRVAKGHGHGCGWSKPRWSMVIRDPPKGLRWNSGSDISDVFDDLFGKCRFSMILAYLTHFRCRPSIKVTPDVWEWSVDRLMLLSFTARRIFGVLLQVWMEEQVTRPFLMSPWFIKFIVCYHIPTLTYINRFITILLPYYYHIITILLPYYHINIAILKVNLRQKMPTEKNRYQHTWTLGTGKTVLSRPERRGAKICWSQVVSCFCPVFPHQVRVSRF